MKNFFDSILIKNEDYLFFDRLLNALCVGSPDFKDNYIIRYLQEDEDVTGFGAIGVFGYENRLYFGNQFGSDVLRFDLETHRFRRLFPSKKRNKEGLIYHTFVFQNKIYRIPRDLSLSGFVFDMETELFEKREAFLEESAVAGFAVMEKDSIYFTISGTNRILRWNLNNDETEWITFREEIKLNNICFFKGKTIAIPYEGGNLYILDGTDVQTITLCDKREKQLFSRIFSYNDLILVLPRHGNDLYTYDYEKNTYIKYPVASIERFHDTDASVCFGYHCEENRILLFPWGGEEIKIFDLENKSVRTVPLEYKSNYMTIQKKGVIMENKETSLNDFLDGISELRSEKYLRD